MTTAIVFRDDQPPVEVEWPQRVKTEPGWVKIIEYYRDESFGDVGVSGDREVVSIPSDRVHHIFTNPRSASW